MAKTKLVKLIERFKTKENFEEFLDSSMFCVCNNRQLLTGLHEMTCPTIQRLKVAFTGKQDDHPAVNVPDALN